MARPREFDIDEVLDAAMEAFWKHGYEATSLADLMDVMNLQKGSIYKAFGDKHSLFLAALERYMHGVFQGFREMVSGAPTPAAGIQQWLDASRCWGQDSGMRKGCFGLNSMVELSPHDPQVKELMQAHFARMEALLVETVTKGQELGEFRGDVPARKLAHYLAVFAAGVVLTSKGDFPGLDQDDLTGVVLSALKGSTEETEE